MRVTLLALLALLSSCSRPHAKRILVPPQGPRKARIFVPARAAPAAGWPLVLVLHGARSSARRAEKVTEWTTLADEQGAVVVYPQGIARSWNDGRSDKVPAAARGVDDVAWLQALLKQVQATTPIDPTRILLTGASNGAMMGWRWVCEGRGLITAFAPVMAGLPSPMANSCAPQPVPTLVIHGDADPLVPYEGGTVGQHRGAVVSTQAALTLMREHNGCSPTPTSTHSWDTVPTDTTSATHTRWSDGCPSAPVEHIRLLGAGHLWPGARQALSSKRVGLVSTDLHGAEASWQFAQRVWSTLQN